MLFYQKFKPYPYCFILVLDRAVSQRFSAQEVPVNHAGTEGYGC